VPRDLLRITANVLQRVLSHFYKSQSHKFTWTLGETITPNITPPWVIV
jgi:hypothetical protein